MQRLWRYSHPVCDGVFVSVVAGGAGPCPISPPLRVQRRKRRRSRGEFQGVDTAANVFSRIRGSACEEYLEVGAAIV